LFNDGDLPNICDDGTGTVTINVIPVNDPPSFLPIIVPPVSDESGLISIATQASVGPPDEAGQKVMQFFVAEVLNAGLFSVPPQFDPDGNLIFQPMPNVKGTAQITVGLKDDGGTANGGIDTDASRTLTIEVFKARVGHNVLKPLDASGDGMIIAGDALDLINFLNAFGAQPVPDGDSAQGSYYDCNGDGFVTAADALDVINHLNAFGPDTPAPAGEGDGQLPSSVGYALRDIPSDLAGPLDLDDLATLLALDVFQVSTRRKR
jgi:hypothetical protein